MRMFIRHMPQKQVSVVIALILNENGELLISQRKDPEFKDADGKWEFVGGKIEFGETPEQAVVREAKEETGLDVEIVRLLPKIETTAWLHANGDNVQVFLFNYVCKIVGGQLHQKEFDHKIGQLKFINPNDIASYETLPNVEKAVKLMLYGT